MMTLRTPSTYLLGSLLVLVQLGTAVSTAGAEDAKAPEKVTFQDHILPLFRAKCGSCHNANDRKGGLALDDYALLLEGGSSGDVVEPGEPEFSYLYSLVTHESEPNMPPNSAKLPDEELALIKAWIEGGLLRDAGSTAMKKKESALGKIEISTERPANVAMPAGWLGDPIVDASQTNAVTALATSPWAPLAAVSGHKQVTLWNTQTLQPLGTIPFPEGQPQILKFSRAGNLLLVGGGRGGASGKVGVYDVATGERVIEVGSEYDEVLAADISPDQSRIALGGPKKVLRVYSTETGELLYEHPKKHTDWVTAIEFSPDGVLLASADRSAGLYIWETHTGREFYNLQGHKAAITDVSWRPDSNAVASASEDGEVKLWEMINGTEARKWGAHNAVTAMDFTREGQLVTVGRDRVARLWNGDGAKVRDFGGLADVGTEVAYDAESKRLLAGDWTGTVYVWNADDAALLGKLTTDPPTLQARINTLAQELAAATQASQQAQASVAAMQKAMADKQAAANTAKAQAEAAAKKLQEVTVSKQETDKLVAAKTAEVKAAEQAVAQAVEKLKQAEAALATAKEVHAKAEQSKTTVAAAATEATTKAQELATQMAAAKAEADKLAAAAAAKEKEAAVTDEQKKTLADAQAAATAAQQRAAELQKLLEAMKSQQPVESAAVTP